MIYELHVRSYTNHPESGVRYKGTFAGFIEKIPYLKELGINCVELMPIFEFDELAYAGNVTGKQLFNYWGYSTICFFAPKAGYAASAPFGMEADELKNMLTILLTSRGIPMLLSGDEFANTQWGNNNAYCQDNEISWLDWSFLKKNKDLYDYVRSLIAFRKAHPVLRAFSGGLLLKLMVYVLSQERQRFTMIRPA